ncbi:hypothetical protein ONS95_001278 [Cadophora gregata]|uniref:uncharacterized protein n=1 Tax=Cadophora gregata TaxID=51156 RepID=UPI0026DB3AA9|nr:uncharacterized protein ONS95_001278 [Cadophora gregata]KAK0101910.1 hypothetical protein ONS96_005884 [Cadophora gregata f. sp. sojae]KAK0129350.1 hypothetical protein ONS95_001278 [Cadophora gregata]
MKVSLAAVLSLGTVSTLLAVTDGTPLGLRGNALNTRSCAHNCTSVATIGTYTTETLSDYLVRKRDGVEGVLSEILARAGPLISPKGPKGKDGDSSSDAAPISFTGGSGDKTDGDTPGSLDGPIIGNRPPADRDGGEGSGTRQPVPGEAAPVTAATFPDAKDEAVRQIGASRQDDLKNAISTNRADNDKGSIESKGYVRMPDEEQGVTGPLHTSNGDQGRYLAQFGIKAAKDVKLESGWRSEKIKNSADEKTLDISRYAVSVPERTIILKDSRNAQHDENLQPGGDEAKALKLRDMTMDSWRVAAGDANTVKDLKWIVRDDVVTTETRQAINAAFSLAGIDRKTKAVFKPTAANPNELAAYQQFAGSIHGRGMLQMLTDHHGELGNLEVMAFHVFTDGTTKNQKNKNPDTVPGYYSIVIELGRL